MQGFPVPQLLARGNKYARLFPIAELVDANGPHCMSGVDIRHLAGNGMHLAALGSVILFRLATCEVTV